MKERFAKLLLGEDLSGGGKGVSSALAISNAITNLSGSLLIDYKQNAHVHYIAPISDISLGVLSVSVFGQLYKLEPLAEEQKVRWRREMGWILSVSDYIVDFVPSVQQMPDGISTEVVSSLYTGFHSSSPGDCNENSCDTHRLWSQNLGRILLRNSQLYASLTTCCW